MGLSSTLAPSMAAAYQTLEREAIPRASSALNILQRVGASVGTAAMAVVLAHNIRTALPGRPDASSLAALQRAAPTQVAHVAAPLARAFSATFWLSFALTAATLVPALLMPRRRRAGDVEAARPRAGAALEQATDTGS